MTSAKDINKALRGKRVEKVTLRPFSDGKGRRSTDPTVFFTDGTQMRFVVEEVEDAYGVRLIVMEAPR